LFASSGIITMASNVNSFGAFLEAVQGVAADSSQPASDPAAASDRRTLGPDLGSFLKAVQRGTPDTEGGLPVRKEEPGSPETRVIDYLARRGAQPISGLVKDRVLNVEDAFKVLDNMREKRIIDLDIESGQELRVSLRLPVNGAIAGTAEVVDQSRAENVRLTETGA
jgi:hypothetical protein